MKNVAFVAVAAGEMLPLYEELARLLRCNVLSYDYAGWGRGRAFSGTRLPGRLRACILRLLTGRQEPLAVVACMAPCSVT